MQKKKYKAPKLTSYGPVGVFKFTEKSPMHLCFGQIREITFKLNDEGHVHHPYYLDQKVRFKVPNPRP